jgi:hypothetical protein
MPVARCCPGKPKKKMSWCSFVQVRGSFKPKKCQKMLKNSKNISKSLKRPFKSAKNHVKKQKKLRLTAFNSG